MEKPILFSTEMVKAILDGRKIQTRRVIKPQPDGIIKSSFVKSGLEDIHGYEIKCSWNIGMKLWVRETWTGDDWCGYAYKADGTTLPIDCGEIEFTRWKPSIYMHRKVSRINLLIKDIRVERIQDISIDDINKEGIACSDCWTEGTLYNNFPHDDRCGCINLFFNLWNSINAKRGYGWNVNPWVFVIEFEKC